MTTCYNCGGTNGAHESICIGGKVASSPAMNTASPTEADKMLAMRAESNRQQAAKRGTLAGRVAPVGQGSAGQRITCVGCGSPKHPNTDHCPECGGAEFSQGSATSGEAVPHEVIADRQYLAGFDAGFMAGAAGDDAKRAAVHEARSSEIRAALAASAEQTSTPNVDAADLIKWVDMGCPGVELISNRRIMTNHIRALAAPVSERAAAPASVPKPAALGVAEQALRALRHMQGLAALPDGRNPRDVLLAYIQLTSDAAPDVAQPAAQGESIDTPEFWKVVKVWNDIPYGDANNEWQAIIDFIHAWGASQRRAGQLSMDAVVVQWGEGQRKYGRRAGIEEAAALYDTSPHAEEFRVNIAESIRALKSLATPAPTAGEPSAEPDDLCNSALRAEPAGRDEASFAVLSAVRDGIPLQEPVSVTKAVLAQREARVVLDGGKGPVACVMLVNIQLTGWAEGPEKAEAFASGYNTAFKWYRGALLDLANKVSADAATRSRVEGGMHDAKGCIKATQGGKEGAG